MADNKEDDLFEPATFKSRIADHTFDIMMGFLVLVVAFEVCNGRRNGIIPKNTTNNVSQTVQSVKNVNQVRAIQFNDTVRYSR